MKINTDKFWYEMGEKAEIQNINSYYIQKQHNMDGYVENYTIRKIVNDFSYQILHLFEEQDYYPINKNFLPDLYEILDTNNKALINIMRKKKLKRLCLNIL